MMGKEALDLVTMMMLMMKVLNDDNDDDDDGDSYFAKLQRCGQQHGTIGSSSNTSTSGKP